MENKGLVKILDVDENGEVMPTIECYTEPYLKAVMSRYDNPIPALCYLYYMTYPYSAYNNLTAKEKEKSILETYPGDYLTEDKELVNAIDILNKRYETPIKRFFMSQKKSLDDISQFHNSFSAKDLDASEKTGTYNTIKKALLDSDKMAQAFANLEKVYIEQVRSRLRGGSEEAYDQNFKD